MKLKLLLLFGYLVLLDCSYSQAQYFLEHQIFTAEELSPRGFHTFNNYLYFRARDGEDTSYYKFYKTNGIVSNISIITDADGNELVLGPMLGEFLGKLYFVASTGSGFNVWATDGSTEGTTLLKDITGLGDPPILGTTTNSMIEVNGTLLFNASDGENNHGVELWKSDGTEEGTELLVDIHPSEDGFNQGFNKLGDWVYFVGNDSLYGKELWKTDGTVEGTTMVKDINPSGNAFGQFHTIVYQNKLFFNASENNYGFELWCTDGTEQGTFEVADLIFNATPFFTIFQDLLYFQANGSGSGFELYRTDGTIGGTQLFADLSASSSWPSDLTLFDDKMFFSAHWTTGCELWYTDGTEQGTQPILTDPPVDDPDDFFIVDDELVFTAMGDYPNPGLWRTDGTVEGTYRLMPEDEIPGWTVQTFGDQTVFQGRYFFDAHINGDGDLWSYGATDIVLSTESFNDLIELTIHPNPAKEFLWVNSQEPIEQVRIYTMEGKLLRTEKINGSRIFSLNISGFSAGGVYLLELFSSSSKVAKKIIIEN